MDAGLKTLFSCARVELKVTLAPCIEGLILMDRLCYLKEQVIKRSRPKARSVQSQMAASSQNGRLPVGVHRDHDGEQ